MVTDSMMREMARLMKENAALRSFCRGIIKASSLADAQHKARQALEYEPAETRDEKQ